MEVGRILLHKRQLPTKTDKTQATRAVVKDQFYVIFLVLGRHHGCDTVIDYLFLSNKRHINGRLWIRHYALSEISPT